ncbi:hypothetical protein [Pseudomonas phage Astolliot]|nr:hypothetical protein [Pseudomonas phage Astolliot]
MTLPVSGSIGLGQVISELKLPVGQISLGQTDVRALAGKTLGQISLSDLWGKSSVPVPVPYGNYTSGGPVNISGGYYYGYVKTNIGAVGPMGTATDLHYLGDYPVVAVLSDAGINMAFKIGGTNSQPPMPYNTFRVSVGTTVYDIPTSELAWVVDTGGAGGVGSGGMIAIHYASGAPLLSPVGTKFKVEFLNI